MPTLKRNMLCALALVCGLTVISGQASASAFSFSTGNAGNAIATASRPGPSSGPDQETESADDFIILT